MDHNSEDGTGAARVLLDYQTPTQIVPAFPDAEPVGGKTSALVTLSDRGVEQEAEEPGPFLTTQDDPDTQAASRFRRRSALA